MADNETPTFEPIVLPYYSGKNLRNTIYAEYIQSILDAIGENASTLFAETVVPELEALRASLQELVKAPFEYVETAELNRKDAYRDKLVSAFFAYFKRLANLPATSALYTAAHALEPFVAQYYGLQELPASQQSNEIRYLCQGLTTEANTVYLTTLGLVDFITELNTVNNAFRTLYRQRNVEKGLRLQKRGGKTVKQCRDDVDAKLKELLVIVNGAHALEPTETTQGIMRELLGVITKYHEIGNSIGGLDTDEDVDPEPTPDPDEGDEGGDGEANGEVA